MVCLSVGPDKAYKVLNAQRHVEALVQTRQTKSLMDNQRSVEALIQERQARYLSENGLSWC